MQEHAHSLLLCRMPLLMPRLQVQVHKPGPPSAELCDVSGTLTQTGAAVWDAITLQGADLIQKIPSIKGITKGVSAAFQLHSIDSLRPIP
jgi:hypothetical protein